MATGWPGLELELGLGLEDFLVEKRSCDIEGPCWWSWPGSCIVCLEDINI